MLIKNMKRALDMTKITRIELWGGETLLYWPDIVQIVEAFDNEQIVWYIPTNGTTLMPKHVEYFKNIKGRVAFGISHDGPGHEELRGKEFIHKKVEVLRSIQENFPKMQFSFNPVISRTNYDLFKINDFFYDYFEKNSLQPVTLSFELGRVYDDTLAKNSTHHVIAGDDLDKYRDVLKRYLNAHLTQYKTLGSTKTGPLLANSLFHTGMGVLPYTKSLQTETPHIIKTNCGVDDKKLISLDIYGNARTCQNVDDNYISGTLLDIKGIKIKKVDMNREWHCGDCRVLRMCKSSCPLDLGHEVFRINHTIEYLHYSVIQNTAFKLLFNSEISPASDTLS